MSDIAVHVERLSKRYYLVPPSHHSSIREALADTATVNDVKTGSDPITR